MKKENEKRIEEIENIIELMEDNGFDTITELRESDVELENDDDIEHIEDLRSLKKDSEDELPLIERPIMTVLERENYQYIIALSVIIAVVMFILQFPFSNPFDLGYPLFLGYVFTKILEQVG